MVGAAVETPSGKNVAYENFPVGSWLLPASRRPHVAAFYAFARAADDIADNPALTPEEKVARLDGFADALQGRGDADPRYAKALGMRDSLAATGVTARHCLDLLAAFRQDATKRRYADWNDLMAYCALSAAPVGRYLLDLHGGSRDGYGPADALCMALQVINHVQDCKADFVDLDRVYLPADWMAAEGAPFEDLARASTSPALRRVLDRALDATAGLMATARRLPAGLRSRRLAMESGAIVAVAERLCALLGRRDPLGPRIVLSKGGFLWTCARGALAALA